MQLARQDSAADVSNATTLALPACALRAGLEAGGDLCRTLREVEGIS